MFSQVSVCPQGGVCHTPPGKIPTPRGDTPQADTPLDRSPTGQKLPPGRHHPQPYTTGYGQQVDDKHPTGMHSCFQYVGIFRTFITQKGGEKAKRMKHKLKPHIHTCDT